MDLETLKIKGHKPVIVLHADVMGSYTLHPDAIPAANWETLATQYDHDNHNCTMNMLCESMPCVKPSLWNAFAKLGGIIMYCDEKEDERLGGYRLKGEDIGELMDQKIRAGLYKTYAEAGANTVPREHPGILVYAGTDGPTMAHELGHFIDDKALTNPKFDIQTLGFHHQNKLWPLLAHAEKELCLVSVRHVSNLSSHYDDDDQESEYFANCVMVAFGPRSKLKLSSMADRYMKSIVSTDIALCLQEKPLDEVMADRIQFRKMINDAIDPAFGRKVEEEARHGNESTVEELVRGKIDDITKQARSTFKLKKIER